LSLFFTTFTAAFGAALDIGVCLFPGIRKEDEAGRSYQDHQEKPYVGFGLHALAFYRLDGDQANNKTKVDINLLQFLKKYP